MKQILIIAFTFLHFACIGQLYVAGAALPTVTQNGFYRVLLSPELIAQLNSDFSNLRLVDSTGHEIPYLLKTELPVLSSSKFIEYPIAEKKMMERFTQIIFTNQEKKSISNISLVIKNAETTKEATLMGSDDRATWYALKEHFVLTPIQGSNQTYEMCIVDFPLSNYPYFKLKINDSTSAPLNILKIGFYDTDQVFGNYNSLSAKLAVQNNKESKKSIVKISFDSAMLIDKLIFNIEEPPFYNRTAVIQMPATRKNRKGKVEHYNEYIQTVKFISKQQASFHLPSVKTKEIDLEISNEDNQPLEITDVKAYQLNRYLIAWLKKGYSYSIKIGPSSMSAPSYDIDYFKDSIPSKPPALKPAAIQILNAKTTEQKASWFTDKRFIWVAIVLVIALLAIMSFRMIKETNTNSNQ